MRYKGINITRIIRSYMDKRHEMLASRYVRMPKPREVKRFLEKQGLSCSIGLVYKVRSEWFKNNGYVTHSGSYARILKELGEP